MEPVEHLNFNLWVRVPAAHSNLMGTAGHLRARCTPTQGRGIAITSGLTSIYTDVPSLRPGTVGAYVLAFVCAGVATALEVAIDQHVGGARYIASLLAVIIATLISGFGAGLFCLAISVAAVDFFLLLYVELPALLVFILAGLSSVILITGMRFAIERKLLQASKARLQLALDAARLGWWQYDLPGRVVLGDTRFEIEFCGGELMPHPTARWWRRPRSWCRCGLPREVTGSTESEKSHNRVR
jgi:hypothetical protein